MLPVCSVKLIKLQERVILALKFVATDATENIALTKNRPPSKIPKLLPKQSSGRIEKHSKYQTTGSNFLRFTAFIILLTMTNT